MEVSELISFLLRFALLLIYSSMLIQGYRTGEFGYGKEQLTLRKNPLQFPLVMAFGTLCFPLCIVLAFWHFFKVFLG